MLDGSAGGHCAVRDDDRESPFNADDKGHKFFNLKPDRFIGLIGPDGDVSFPLENETWGYLTEADTWGPRYVRGINGFVGIEEGKTASSITYAKAQPLSKDIAGEMSWTNHAGEETPYFDNRYEKWDEVSVFVLAPQP